MADGKRPERSETRAQTRDARADGRRLSRRAFVAGAALAGGPLAACSREPARAPEALLAPDACASPARRQLRILTWNVFMMPSWVGESPRNRERAAAIGDVLLEQDFDVLCLQKVFDGAARGVLQRKLKGKYPYQFGPANDSRSLKLNSGVWVLSRIPLLGYREIEFDDCGGVECFARKGAISLAGACGATQFQLIATHLQGEEGRDYAIANEHVRVKQMMAIRDRLIVPYHASSVPQILCGDLCTSRFTEMFHRENPSYVAMLATFGAENGREERITLDDSAANQLALDRTGRRSEMDYVLVRPNGCDLVIERTRHTFRRSGWDDAPSPRVDLSYRYAVSATLTFPAPGSGD